MSLIEKVKPHMEALDFVEWDRYTVGPWDENTESVTVYGWIDRKDLYKDYVQLTMWEGTDNVWFTTSSAEYTEEIYETLFDKPLENHQECQRVEDAVDLDNVVEL